MVINWKIDALSPPACGGMKGGVFSSYVAPRSGTMITKKSDRLEGGFQPALQSWCNASFLLSFLTLLIFLSCGENPPDKAPTLPPPVEWRGDVYLSIRLQTAAGDTIAPDMIIVVLGADSLGYKRNLDTLHNIAEGNYILKVYGWWQGLLYRASPQTIIVEYNRTVTAEAMLTRSGALYVTVQASGALVSEFNLKIDSDTTGSGSNPRCIDGVPMGTHKLTAFRSENSLDYEGWAKNIMVNAAETTAVTIDLIVVAPDSGAHSPDLEALDADGQIWALSDHWDKVIYIYFYESA